LRRTVKPAYFRKDQDPKDSTIGLLLALNAEDREHASGRAPATGVIVEEHGDQLYDLLTIVTAELWECRECGHIWELEKPIERLSFRTDRLTSRFTSISRRRSRRRSRQSRVTSARRASGRAA
jgi:hypothetical protein